MRGKPYYVQRCKQLPNADGSGSWFDAIIQYDYMGSSEFEGNWQFKSLEHIRKNLEHYHEIKVSWMGAEEIVVTVFVDKRFEKEYRKHLDDLADGRTRLFEYCDFYDAIEGDNPRNDFWWDLENNVMFWIDKNGKFNKEFAKRIRPQTELVMHPVVTWRSLWGLFGKF